MSRRLLLLAGTGDARQLADNLANDRNWHVVASLAGVTDAPAALPVEVRTGGFGGAGGLAEYLKSTGVDVVIDATHPFAQRMTHNAVEACRAANVPLLRIERPPWSPPQNAEWIRVATLEAAALLLPAGARVFLTVGANSLAPFAARDDVWFLVRTMDGLGDAPFAQYDVVAGAPPGDSETEARLMREHRITHLVSKNAGGAAYAIDRPPAAQVESVADAAAALEWLNRFAAVS
jgi:precorrin-6A/cobalt-precorrin-6A reductase